MRARPPDRTGEVQRDGVRVRYEVFGAATRSVLMLPPRALTPARIWKAQIPYVERLGRGEQDGYDDWEKFNPAYWQRDWPGFAAWWVGSKVCAEPHSTKQRDDAIGWVLESDPEAFTANVVALGANQREAVLAMAARVRCPALIIYDDEHQIAAADTWTPLAEAARARLLRIPGANHSGPGRYPVPFNLALREFLESLERGPVSERRTGATHPVRP